MLTDFEPAFSLASFSGTVMALWALKVPSLTMVLTAGDLRARSLGWL
jgi:hypothetical protein